jgi:hypothetical protein
MWQQHSVPSMELKAGHQQYRDITISNSTAWWHQYCKFPCTTVVRTTTKWHSSMALKHIGYLTPWAPSMGTNRNRALSKALTRHCGHSAALCRWPPNNTVALSMAPPAVGTTTQWELIRMGTSALWALTTPWHYPWALTALWALTTQWASSMALKALGY